MVNLTNIRRNMRRTISIAAAKARLTDCVRVAENGDAVVITRYGRPVAALVSTGLLQEVERLRAVCPRGGLASLVGRYDDGAELARELHRIVKHRRKPRAVSDLP
jgi:prevent-host-death family protein